MSGTTTPSYASQGTLNRLRGSVVIPSYTALNVTAGFLGKEGITLRRGQAATDYIATMTGAVRSPAAYIMISLTIHLLRTQGLSGSWEAQAANTTLLGTVTFHADTAIAGVSSFTFREVAIVNLPDVVTNGLDPSYTVVLAGVQNINSSLFNIT